MQIIIENDRKVHSIANLQKIQYNDYGGENMIERKEYLEKL